MEDQIPEADGDEEPERSSRHEAPLDRLALERLRADLGASGPLPRLVETFSSQTAPRVAELRAASDAGDWSAVTSVAHWIKGGAASLAATELSELCGEIETAVRTGNVDRVPALIDSLELCFERTRIALQDEIPADGSDSGDPVAVRVLIADDDALVRMLASAVIEGEGSLELAGEAEDADQAVELAERDRPDVAVLDWSMPGGGSPEAARRIVARSPGTRIVAFTAADHHGATTSMHKAGAKAVVVKGGPPDELIEAIREAAAS